MSTSDKQVLFAHLLGNPDGDEEVAFTCARVDEMSAEITFEIGDLRLIERDEFRHQGNAGLELTDTCRASVIKWAHDRGASLVEFHSHPGGLSPAFSLSDLAGFHEFVPHVRWRLHGRPYAAVVVANTGLDALAWIGADTQSVQVDALVAGEETILSSCQTLAAGRRRSDRRTLRP